MAGLGGEEGENMAKEIGVMQYCHDLESKARQARRERDLWKLRCLWVVSYGKWWWAFCVGMIVGASLTFAVVVGVKIL